MSFRHIEAVKRQETMTPQEVLSGLIFAKALKSKDHYFKIPFYEFPCHFEFSAESMAFLLDVYYAGQEKIFSLIQPDYQSVLAIAPSILDWLDSVYATIPPEAKPRKRQKDPNSQTYVPGSPPSQSARQPG